MKNFLDTNITTEVFINSLKSSAQNLPQLLSDWKTIDPELKEEYSDQMIWLLNKAVEFIEKSKE